MSGPGLLERGLLIGGDEVAASDGGTLDVVNPTNGAAFGRAVQFPAARYERRQLCAARDHR